MEMIKMVVVLTILSVISGGGLKWLQEFTKPMIEVQELELVKGPAIRDILKGASNDPVESRFKIQDGEEERTVFVGAFDGEPKVAVLEVSGTGFADKFGLLVAFDVKEDKLAGISVTTHKETPGLGAEAKNPVWAAQFKGKPITKECKVTNDGGDINALSGATITSRAVCSATNQAIAKYQEFKPQLIEKMKSAVK
ncbi:MAG: RnfABCDGE type electron transport complex subunit G [Desulfobacteraceae bacterium]|nr:MAG: RnfABCDGE type electron transport complex subunit G [Desulfobacteraceae bacterium]